MSPFGLRVRFRANWNALAEFRRTDYGSAMIALPFLKLSTTSTTETTAIDLGVN
jgi:hypothetical protein